MLPGPELGLEPRVYRMQSIKKKSERVGWMRLEVRTRWQLSSQHPSRAIVACLKRKVCKLLQLEQSQMSVLVV